MSSNLGDGANMKYLNLGSRVRTASLNPGGGGSMFPQPGIGHSALLFNPSSRNNSISPVAYCRTLQSLAARVQYFAVRARHDAGRGTGGTGLLESTLRFSPPVRNHTALQAARIFRVIIAFRTNGAFNRANRVPNTHKTEIIYGSRAPSRDYP